MEMMLTQIGKTMNKMISLQTDLRLCIYQDCTAIEIQQVHQKVTILVHLNTWFSIPMNLPEMQMIKDQIEEILIHKLLYE